MNAYDHQLLEATWSSVTVHGAATAARFYDELFARDASLRLLFLDADLAASGAALMHAIGVAVANAPRLMHVVEQARADGAVTQSAVRLVGSDNLAAQALLAALEHTLDTAWTPPVRDLWIEFCGLLSASQRHIVRRVRRAA